MLVDIKSIIIRLVSIIYISMDWTVLVWSATAF